MFNSFSTFINFRDESALKIDLSEPSVSQTTKQLNDGEQTSLKPLKPIVVRVVPKVVKLPENEVTLSAYTVPSEQTGFFFLSIIR